ncbi:MAG: enoyl-CoA hydratase-related protein [Chloroflexota bacterium]
MKYEYCIYEKKGRIAYITLNRPEVMNSLHILCHRELDGVWNDFRDDPEVWVAIFTGTGEKAFSAGNDLKYTAEHPEVLNLPHGPGGFGGITLRNDLWKPVIAAVNGFALGGGLEMALACDIIVAADHARFGLPEPTVGLIARGGGLHRLPRQIPLKLAMGMILTGRHTTAQEAYRIGLVNEVVPLKDLMTTAEKWAADILRCAPMSIRASKEASMRGLALPLLDAINTVNMEQKKWENSEDRVEGPKAFAAKRPPQWKGR